MNQAIYVLGTMDAKGHELAYLAERIRAAGATPVLGTQSAPQVSADIARETVAAHHPGGAAAVLGLTGPGEREIPCVPSLGALDTVNFGAKETVPTEFHDRLLHVHNSQVIRTTVRFKSS